MFTGSCECFKGFAGVNCTLSDKLNCTSSGAVQNDGSCICSRGYIGSKCELCSPGFWGPKCNECLGGADNPCGGGICVGSGTKGGSGKCEPGKKLEAKVKLEIEFSPSYTKKSSPFQIT